MACGDGFSFGSVAVNWLNVMKKIDQVEDRAVFTMDSHGRPFDWWCDV